MEKFNELGKQKCKILEATDKNIRLSSNKILEGELIIFPMETVYGIGANGLDSTSVNKIYEIKKRSPKNPVILHCLGFEDSIPFLNLTEIEKNIYTKLSKKFWPGPLTIVAKSSDIIPNIVKANGDYVAFRAPSNKIVRKLIQYASVPIAVSSANISGKTSSTCLEHVLKYFDLNKTTILNDKDYICTYGIESTVVKIDGSNLTILRKGIITKSDIEIYLSKLDLPFNPIIKYNEKHDETDLSSPGLLKSHYCPDKPLYILNIVDYGDLIDIRKYKENIKNVLDEYLDSSILIDFNSLANKYKDKFMGYVDLSVNGDFKEAIFNLYNVFHQVSQIKCKKLFIYNFNYINDQHNEALWERIYKATEGKIIGIPLNLII